MSRTRRIIFSLVAAVAAYLLAEVTALLVLWVGWGQRPLKYDEFVANLNSQATNVYYSYEWNPHPYLGFRSPRSLNDLETVQKNAKPDNEFWVGVFGGSFAEMLVVDLEAKRKLETGLQALPAAKGRKVRVLQLAHGGYKQPQQLILYTLYGEKLDLVINLEGVNEISDFMLGYHFPFDYPVTSFRYLYHELPGQLYVQLSKFLVVLVHQGYFGVLKTKIHHYSPLATLSIFGLIQIGGPLHSMIQDIFQRTYRQAFPEQLAYGSPEVLEQLLAIWERATRSQFDLAGARQIPSFVFIQPNQYLEESKPFSEWELANAIAPDRRFRRQGYAHLLHLGYDLKDKGLPIYDLSFVFSQTQETVYIDNCCHINALGNQIVADAIIETILRSPATK